MNDNFEGIANKLNIKNDINVPVKLEEQTPQISNFETVTEDNFEIVDAAYIANEIKDVIAKTKRVQNTLANDIKKNTEPRMYEVFSDITNSISTALEKLTDLNKAVVAAKSLKLKKKVLEIGTSNNNQQGIIMTPQQLAAMINAAKDGTQLKEIDAKFIIDSEQRN